MLREKAVAIIILNGRGKNRILFLMDNNPFYPQDSIAALATPWGESALAVIRVSGMHSLELLDPLFLSLIHI